MRKGIHLEFVGKAMLLLSLMQGLALKSGNFPQVLTPSLAMAETETSSALASGISSQALRALPVQDGGRVKPYDSFARDALKLIYGRETYQGKDAATIVFTWMMIPEHWDNTPIVQVRHSGLREALKLNQDPTRVYYSPKELFNNERVGLLIQEMRTKVQSREKLNPYFQAIQTLENQLGLYHAIRLGRALRVVPGVTDSHWKSVAELDGELKTRFEEITKNFVKVITSQIKGGHLPLESSEGKEGSDSALKPQSSEAEVSVNQEKTLGELDEAIGRFEELARAVNPQAYGNETKIKAELHLNVFHPFMWAWVFYLLGALFLFASRVNNKSWLSLLGFIGVGLGWGLHTYGMAIRSYILGRPPVSNMYETVVWVPWGAVVFATVMQWKSRNKTLLLIASLIAVMCLILTDLAPAVLDKSLQPLQPVLRDNFWLSTHVLIIVLSYAAFFLAFALADLQLFYFLKDEKGFAAQIREGTQSIYRAIQVGVVLLGGGIILGGIWADYSWGRFWGWDPKETWALIAWFGYLAILHARLGGWVRNFGLAVCSVVAFSLVIMAWYGVNFVLGAGLHSYGFGAGGVEYVAAFVAIHLLWVVYVSAVRYSRAKAVDPL